MIIKEESTHLRNSVKYCSTQFDSWVLHLIFNSYSSIDIERVLFSFVPILYSLLCIFFVFKTQLISLKLSLVIGFGYLAIKV
ncbi:hypothetical protein KEM48_012607 [Puccinia striiformis f. sp. tritici PST-130]|nr:hypothetical protein H4Q26_013435 [Puccinia striiformis f. sp. tritici PST-130]KAI9629781.1 hypothetical protein KEM48_012607 [Puccinia striiformis f. sp. tritici PST-130]